MLSFVTMLLMQCRLDLAVDVLGLLPPPVTGLMSECQHSCSGMTLLLEHAHPMLGPILRWCPVLAGQVMLCSGLRCNSQTVVKPHLQARATPSTPTLQLRLMLRPAPSGQTRHSRLPCAPTLTPRPSLPLWLWRARSTPLLGAALAAAA